MRHLEDENGNVDYSKYANNPIELIKVYHMMDTAEVCADIVEFIDGVMFYGEGDIIENTTICKTLLDMLCFEKERFKKTFPDHYEKLIKK